MNTIHAFMIAPQRTRNGAAWGHALLASVYSDVIKYAKSLFKPFAFVLFLRTCDAGTTVTLAVPEENSAVEAHALV